MNVRSSGTAKIWHGDLTRMNVHEGPLKESMNYVT